MLLNYITGYIDPFANLMLLNTTFYTFHRSCYRRKISLPVVKVTKIDSEFEHFQILRKYSKTYLNCNFVSNAKYRGRTDLFITFISIVHYKSR